MKSEGPAQPSPSSSARARVRRLRALFVKEARQIVRDPSSLLIAIVVPLILLFLFGYGVSLDTSSTRVGVVIESPSPSSRDLASAFSGSPYFDVQLGTDRREFEAPLLHGKIRGIIVIPASFDADLRKRSAPPEIQVIVDGSDPNTAALVQGYVQGATASWASRRAAENGLANDTSGAIERYWFNPARTSRYYLVPGSIAIVMALVGTLLTSLVVAREWERGTMEAMMATPVTAIELLVGKLVPYFVLGLVSVTLCVVVAIWVFHIPLRGSLLALYALASAFLVPALGQGLLISAATKNQFLSSQLALMSSFLPTFLLSGFLFEINSMPKLIQWITTVVPARWIIPSLQTVFLAGDLWPLFGRSMGVLAIFGVVFLALAVRSTKKRVA